MNQEMLVATKVKQEKECIVLWGVQEDHSPADIIIIVQ